MPYLILGLPLGILALLFMFVVVPVADISLDARTTAGVIMFALVSIVGTALLDYDQIRKRRSTTTRKRDGFEWRTLNPAELKQLPVPLLAVALGVPFVLLVVFRNDWFGFPLSFALACLCGLGLSAYSQRRSR